MCVEVVQARNMNYGGEDMQRGTDENTLLHSLTNYRVVNILLSWKYPLGLKYTTLMKK